MDSLVIYKLFYDFNIYNISNNSIKCCCYRCSDDERTTCIGGLVRFLVGGSINRLLVKLVILGNFRDFVDFL